jgi:hypothetical protein
MTREEAMAAIRPLAVLAFGALLAACSNNPRDPKLFGLVAGEPPPPKPFVVESRPTTPGVYPAVGVTPPERRDKILPPAERDALEAELRRAGGLPPKKKLPQPAAAGTAPVPPG